MAPEKFPEIYVGKFPQKMGAKGEFVLRYIFDAGPMEGPPTGGTAPLPIGALVS